MGDAEHGQEPAQPTQPKGIDPKTGKPYELVEIPVPKLSAWDKVMTRATQARLSDDREQRG
jgi:hypothetical protein